MALTKAIAGGMVAAVALPTALAGHSGTIGDYVRAFSDRLTLGSFHFEWSWTIFAAVTLFAWAFLAWANK